MHGDDGDDTLYGDDGDDIIYGETGHDDIYGGAEADTLYGGTDATADAKSDNFFFEDDSAFEQTTCEFEKPRPSGSRTERRERKR